MSNEVVSFGQSDAYSGTVSYGSLVDAVDASIAAMDWVTDADDAAVTLARTYAQRIDEAVAVGEGQEVTKALYLGPHLLNTLRALGGAPDARGQLDTGKPASAAASALDKYRQRAKSSKGA